ncbi:prefoldin subunit 5 [Nasonia vitripennis]|uniref:Prefoldin subunit 5 n=1 Tax=Nasonia vitripennis TaxID=7425 RepID=A0A7M7LK25_NASVI|nr:prefoldin subunit 5 [Nasonia vitripennis]
MSQISLTEQPHLQQVDLTQLSLQQLTQLKQQLDQELMVFQDSLHSLKIAQSKFQESNECLDKFTPNAKGKEILVPLTGSMYVPGKLVDTEKVLIDIGTGYYAEKNIPDAKEYFKRRVVFVTEQMEKIQAIGQEKSKIREATIDVMEMKLEALQNKVAE